MKTHRTQYLFLTALLISTAVGLRAKEEPGEIKSDEAEATSAETDKTPVPQERPRLFHPTDMHPFATDRAIYLDPWLYGRHSYYGGYMTDPFGYGYGFRGLGYRSPLYFDTFYGAMPAPGHTELSVSVGSDDYFGSSISTTQWISQKYNIALNIGALWEQGEQWWNGLDYDSFTIAPTLYWSNENTFIYASFMYTERHVASPVLTSAQSATPRYRPTLSKTMADENMSPFNDQIASDDTEGDRFLAPEIRFNTSGDYTLKNATIGLEHKITDSFRIGLNFEASDFDRKRK